ncbi:MAG: sterol desaturase family protein, partial [Bacteroidota bacterium]|nr:sterol desaturase family protein [Bacteroidota bacterium]
MDITNTIEAAGISLLFLVLVFFPMEKVFPARAEQKFFRKHWLLDLCFFLGQYLLWNGFVLWALSYVNFWLSGIIPHDFRNMIASESWWAQA